MRLRAPLLFAAFLLLALQGLAQPVFAALDFPALSGRVVDTANILSSADESRLTKQLASHEQATSNQLVVVTLPALQGTAIEDFGYQLGRHWGIGQEGRNNGVLLIVAPNERKVRIEVGYGLEGDLPDAITKSIIENEILPAFRSEDYPRGIAAGVDAIIEAIAGAYEPVEKKAPDQTTWKIIFVILLVIGIGVNIYFGDFFSQQGGRRGRDRLGGGGFGGGGFGGGGGGFSGGGGGFGGGGSSGSW